MAFGFVVAVLAAVVFHRAFTEIQTEVPECSLIQYLDIGRSGLIQCSFNEGFSVVTWYNVNERRPILLYHDGVKSGEGYTSGEFDIYANGSLVIKTVAVEHEAVYTVTRAMSSAVSAVSYDISVYTTVTPATTIPVIDQCSYKFVNVCMKSTLNQIEVTCAIRGSRPAIDLSWKKRTHERDIFLPSNYMNFTQNNVTFTSRVTTKFFFEESTFLTLLVCQAFSVPLNLKEENIILIERQIDYNSILTPDKKNVKIHSRMALSCNDRVLNLITWKRYNDRQTDAETMFFSIFQSSNPILMTYKEYKLEVDGSLSLENTLVEHEGLYACTHDNGVGGGIKLHNVSVIVDPTPALPVVDGCNPQQYCVLEKGPGGVLTCSVLGIRPEVSLEWRAFRQETHIVFTQHAMKVTQKGDVYDVSLTVNYDITQTAPDKITLECRAVGENSELFSLSTKVDLLFNNVLLRERDSNILTVVIIVGVLLTIIVIISVVLMFTCRKRRATRSDMEETMPMINKDYSEKVENFIKQLKAKYEIFYDSVQPIPYVKDRMYCVDKVFVEGGIDIMTGTFGGKSLWDKLTSYQELVSENCLKTKRQILEGEPGYGKSTLTLQLLYDWCKSLSTSPLKGEDVIIYLRLRQLGGVKSIFSAIRRFILPMDSDISEEDIKTILNQMNSVLVLLDGFDEYPDQESTETDIYHILKKQMFQGCNVILTTRPSCVPQDFAPHCDRVRLTGFGEEARRKYVEKAVIGKGGKAVDTIMGKLQKNPVLDDLCQVPLFFVMFAHMTHEKEQLVTFNSVTSFFRFMIDSFHSHMRNKMKDDNVEKFQLMENEHKDLDKIAFEALSGKNQKIVWDREQLRNLLGHEFYDQYIRIGILVEEEILNIPDKLYPQSHIQYKTEVRFYHKLFCEWYAAHYVAEQLASRKIDSIYNFLQKLDPFDLQYMYRFACGLNKIAAGTIIQYLQNEIEGNKFAILCMLEQEDKTDRFIKTVSNLVSSSVTTINKDESKLLQRSTLQILDVAAKKQVPISCLLLDKSLSEASDEGISLESGFHIPVLSTIKKIEVRSEKGTELTNDQMLGVVSYAQQCHKLTKLIFVDCLLPLSFSIEFLSFFLKSKHPQVMWQPSKHEFSLDISTGTWKLRNSQESLVLTDESSLPRLCSEIIYLRRTDSRQVQSNSIVLLEVASSLNVPISCLILDKSLSEASDDGISLESGFHIPVLSTIKKIEIRSEKGTELTIDQMLGVVSYVQQCHKLTKLIFIDCLLPLLFPTKFLSTFLNSEHPQVLWQPSKHEFSLDISKGTWKLHNSQESLVFTVQDESSLPRLCSKTIFLRRNDSRQVQSSSIVLLEVASSLNVPISCLILDKSLSEASDEGFSLESGFHIPVLSTIKKIKIRSERGTELTNGQMLGVVSYAQQCHKLTKLIFIDCLLPLSFSIEFLSSFMKSKHPQVLWQPSKHEFSLDISKGTWQLRNSQESLVVTDESSLPRLCSKTIILRRTDSRQVQSNSIVLLEVASSFNIPISHLYIQRSFSGFDGKDIRLESGLCLSSLSSVETITINEGRQKQEFTEEEVIGLINYGIKSPRFKELRLGNCNLPPSIKPDIIPEEASSRNIKVISLREACYLDLKSGKWSKPHDIQTITEMCSRVLVIDRDTSESVQRSVIELLVEASKHDIPIFQVDLGLSFSKIDEDGNIILSSGLSLPIIKSIEGMHIHTEKRRVLNEHEVNEILKYPQNSQRFKELVLVNCLLPSPLPIGPSLSALKSRGVKVFWIPDNNKWDQQYFLDQKSGVWLKQ